MRKHLCGAVVLASLLSWPEARADQTAVVDFKCKETVVSGSGQGVGGLDDYMEACIRDWLPKYLATTAKSLKPSGPPAIIPYASMGDGATCGPAGDDEGGDVIMKFIVLIPVRGDDLVSKLVLKVETALRFCHEETHTRLTGTINEATVIR